MRRLCLWCLSLMHVLPIHGSVKLLCNDQLYAGADSYRIGQSFTVSEVVTLSEIEVFVIPTRGGAAFDITLSRYDPWTEEVGTSIETIQVALNSIPQSDVGAWVTVGLPIPVELAESGVYAITLDTIQGPEDNAGYNNYGYSEVDVISGGTAIFVNGRPQDLLLRLYGVGGVDSLRPGVAPDPVLTLTSVEERYSPVFRTELPHVNLQWNSSSNFVYQLWRSENLLSWFDREFLGDGQLVEYVDVSRYFNFRFFRIEAIPLGDYKK